MQRFNIKLPFMKLNFLYNNEILYEISKTDKGKTNLNPIKSGTTEECLNYITTVYRIGRNYIKEETK